MNKIISFFLISIGLSIFIGIATFMAIDYFQINLNKNDAILCISFFCIVTCLVFFISYLGIKKGHQESISFFYAALAIRFISTLLYILFYVKTHKGYQIAFIFYFLLLFILFIIFEIYKLTTKLRSDSERK